ncbi:hypothetical protein Pcinc_025427 [Petrolisthes cinctipes]|uniref:WAP domain-containing protein n=1 Tax=Petrolisthes cinctipes TaxID=88211 RepID=A0AAE1F7Z3_PETCI|nr:hypothetical protein Pcinc_025427 [Petrolisthes cinctipes]
MAGLAAGQTTHAKGDAVAEPMPKEGATEGAAAVDAAAAADAAAVDAAVVVDAAADVVVDAAADVEGRTKGSSSPRIVAGGSSFNSNAGRPFQQGFNSNAGRPFQQGFNSNAGRPFQQGFNSNAGRPIQLGSFNSNAGRPFQQGNFNSNSNTGRPFQQGNSNSNAGRPFQQGGFNSQSGLQGNLGNNFAQPGLQQSFTLGHTGGVTSNLGLGGGQGIGTGLVGGVGQHAGSLTLQRKCKFFCNNKFGVSECCERPGFCPAVRPSCPRLAAAPQICINDIDCNQPSKCCFDVCLCKSVCKPSQSSPPPVTFESTTIQCLAQQQSLL